MGEVLILFIPRPPSVGGLITARELLDDGRDLTMSYYCFVLSVQGSLTARNGVRF